jgi:hypothetical protein
MPRTIPAPCDPAELRRFLDTFLYDERAFLVDEIRRIDEGARAMEAILDTRRELPITAAQRTGPRHPAHVSGGELIHATGSLGCLHAWFFHGVRWDEGWSGFGNRIHRADFKRLARVGPPLRLESRETQSRVGSRRLVIRFEFRFWQRQGTAPDAKEALVYAGDQTAMFLRGVELESGADEEA